MRALQRLWDSDDESGSDDVVRGLTQVDIDSED